MPTQISYATRAYTTKRLSQVRANIGNNHYVTGVLTVPTGIYNCFINGVFSITTGYEPEILVGPTFHVSLSVRGDNPLFVDMPNRNWQEIRTFKKKSSYSCIGSTELDLSKQSNNTIEVRVGLRDSDSPIVPGDGYDDTTVFIFSVNTILTVKSAYSDF